MARTFRTTSAAGAIERLAPGMKVLLPPGCGEPRALVAEVCRQSARLRDLTLMGGIHLGEYPWARPEHAALRYATWHMSPRLEDARRRGRVEFVPMRYFDLVTEFARGGRWAPDAVLVHTAPPDARGYLSLGVSVSVALPAARTAPLVIAQVNPRMPRARGNGVLHVSQVDVCVEVDEPLAEAMGTRRTFDFLHDNAAVNMESSAFVHDPEIVARLDRFVAINSALEIDLTGQVTAESLGARQVAGIGGQFDFVLGASRSAGGASIIALPSTGGRDGAVSRIVPRLATGAGVTTPRYLADWVVTEHGAARLKGLSDRARATALIAVAHPRFQGELERALATS